LATENKNELSIVFQNISWWKFCEIAIQISSYLKAEKKTVRESSWVLMPVILATQEAEIRKITVRSQPKKIVRLCLEKLLHKNRAGRVAQGKGPEFKPLYHKEKLDECSD
jgi:hypothetical protein